MLSSILQVSITSHDQSDIENVSLSDVFFNMENDM